MALKTKYGKQDDIPEAMRGLYKQVGSDWVLDIEGDDDSGDGNVKKKLQEFRDIAKRQRDQLEALQKKVASYGDIDPDTLSKALEALSRTQNDEEQQLVKSGRIDELVNRRTRALQEQAKKREEEWTKKLDAESKAGTEARSRYASLHIQSEVQRAIAAKKLQLKPTAMEDLSLRALRAWKLGDDLGLQANFTTDAGEEPTMDLFVQQLVDKAPHLFVDSEGGGTKPGSGHVGVQRVKSISGADLAKNADAIASGKMVIG